MKITFSFSDWEPLHSIVEAVERYKKLLQRYLQ